MNLKHIVLILALLATLLPRPMQAAVSVPPPILISALLAHGNEGSADEAVQLTNTSAEAITLDAHWLLRNAAGATGQITSDAQPLQLPPGGQAWLARDAVAFARRFGISPTRVLPALPALPDAGGVLQLITRSITLKDTANSGGGAWPAPAKAQRGQSMERRNPAAPDTAANWAAAVMASGFDGGGHIITGTPRAPNSTRVFSDGPQGLGIVINEVAWAGTQTNANHEWIELFNSGGISVDLNNWLLEVVGSSVKTITLTGEIAPGGYYLIATSAAVFDGDQPVDRILGSGSAILSNSGAALRLVQQTATVIDTVVYGNAAPIAGWNGPPLQPYVRSGLVSAGGQLLWRAQPLRDDDTAQDWINDRDDALAAARPVLPAWHQYEAFRQPVRASSNITIAVAPDASFVTLRHLLQQARVSVDLQTYTFDHPDIVALLRDRIAAGVRVRLLLDGSPAGGLSMQSRWACAEISRLREDSGCWFMRSVGTAGTHAYIPKRYDALHAKQIIVDGRWLMVGSENLGLNGFPADDLADGTFGHRGALAIVDAPALIARAQAIFDADFDARFGDVARWQASDPERGAPLSGFVPFTMAGTGSGYMPRFSQPLILRQPVTVTLHSSPENHLGTHGLLGLLNSLGPGDQVLTQQLNEPAMWGEVENPRIAALIQAAKRGARARVLLDGFYGGPVLAQRPNSGSMRYINTALGSANTALVGNPTGGGIHNKAWLIQKDGHGVSNIGSWNGTESSAKLNREISLMIESDAVHAYLRSVFMADVQRSQPLYLPFVAHQLAVAAPLTRVLISEVMIDPAGLDDAQEWVELFNPSSVSIDLSNHKIGDAESAGRHTSEGMHRFPDGFRIAPRGVVVVAQNALLFAAAHNGRQPTFELMDSDPTVPELASYDQWSIGTLQLNNLGDQVLLLGPDDVIIDAVQWGNAVLAGNRPFTGTLVPGHTLMRMPFDKDSDDANVDFRDQPYDSPGQVP